MKAAIILPALAVILACPTGTTVRKFAPAQSPYGVQADIRGDRKLRIVGELLEVGETTLLVLREGTRVMSVSIQEIRSASFAKVGMLIVDGHLSGRDRDRLRLVSRYPAGLRPEIATQLLAAYGQTEPDRVTPP